MPKTKYKQGDKVVVRDIHPDSAHYRDFKNGMYKGKVHTVRSCEDSPMNKGYREMHFMLTADKEMVGYCHSIKVRKVK